MTNKLQTLSAPRDLLEKSLASVNGIRVWFPTSEAAISMRNRIQTVKTEDRKQSCKLYQLGNPLYNCSQYDSIACIIQPVEVYTEEFAPKPGQPKDGYWLYINPEIAASSGFYIEEL